jgi:hypothetical protein
MRFRPLMCAAVVVAPMFATVNAQSAAPPLTRRFGIMAGVNSSTLGGDVENVARRTGFIGGVLLVVPFGPTVALQPELFYTMKGAKGNSDDFDATVKIDYFELPLLLRFDVPASGGMRPFFYGGPAVSWKASCNFESNSTGVNVNFGCEELTGNQVHFNTTDYGAIVGAGVGFDLSGRTASIGVRYDHGFGKINDDGDVRNRVISVLGTLEFPWPQ